MSQKINEEHIAQLASAGYYISLRIGFAVPVEEINALPPDWVRHYTENRYMMFDPVVHWVYANVGSIRWSALAQNDPRRILSQAKSFGMPYGVAISVFDGNKQGQRSYGTFARADREFEALEIRVLQAYLARRHKEMAPPTNLTDAELEALDMVRRGLRLKEIAFELGVSEGAIKQRLKNAKLKLGAKTGSQAASLAFQYGLI